MKDIVLKYDVIYDKNGIHLDYHFCREFDENMDGCFGTNEDHGFSFEEAKEEVAIWHEQRAKDIRSITAGDYHDMYM